MKKLLSLLYIILGLLVLDLWMGTGVPTHYRDTPDFERYHTEAFSEKMRELSRVAPDLELIVLGDSRARHGIDPAFFGSQNDRGPVTAYNLAPASGGIAFTARLLEEHLDRFPKLRTVVWGVSPRIFSGYWKDPIFRLYTDSFGYRFHRLMQSAPPAGIDSLTALPESLRTRGRVVFERMFSEASRVFAHRSILKSIALDRIAPLDRPRFVVDDRMDLSRWGYMAMPHRRYLDTGAADELERYKRNHRRGAFRFEQERFDEFQAVIERLDARGVTLAAFVPPMHPVLSKTPVADHDGTPHADYRGLIARLKRLEDRHANFIFRDFHRAGKNDFRDAHWANYDHLTPGGAAVLTARLDGWLKQAGHAPAPVAAASASFEIPKAGGLQARSATPGDQLLSSLERFSQSTWRLLFPELEAAPKDATPPRARHNRDGDYSIVDMMREPYPAFTVTYSDPESGIDAASVRIFVNDEDVTSQAKVTGSSVTYKPKQKPETGLYSARVIVKDKAGNKTEVVWDIMYQEC